MFVGVSPEYDWGRVYGGQVIAQGLRAASLTVDADHRVHSVQAYFIRGGDHNEPIRYEVDRIRNGRSFTTRRVVARQSNGAILNLAVSFHGDEDDAEVQIATLPELDGGLPHPEDLVTSNWGTMMDLRVIPLPAPSSRSLMWIKADGPLETDPVIHTCALAYISDANPMDAVGAAHPRNTAQDNFDDVFMGASLDHAIWFHRPVEADRWLLFDLEAHTLGNSRGLAIGTVFTPDGTLVASIAQEGLLRLRR